MRNLRLLDRNCLRTWIATSAVAIVLSAPLVPRAAPPPPQFPGSGTSNGKLWCSFHDQSFAQPGACVGGVSICSAGPPKVECCSHMHLGLKAWQCAPGGERRKGPFTKKYFELVSGDCFLDQCIDKPPMPCPEHWVDECHTLDCF